MTEEKSLKDLLNNYTERTKNNQWQMYIPRDVRLKIPPKLLGEIRTIDTNNLTEEMKKKLNEQLLAKIAQGAKLKVTYLDEGKTELIDINPEHVEDLMWK